MDPNQSDVIKPRAIILLHSLNSSMIEADQSRGKVCTQLQLSEVRHGRHDLIQSVHLRPDERVLLHFRR